jgi:hypothetical protein
MPARRAVTLLDDGRAVATEATFEGDAVRLAPAALHAALGWEVRPEGLCRGAVCLPADRHRGLVTPDGVDVGALAALLDRPLAGDRDEGVLCLGASAAERGARLASLEAPDFTLPDLDGRPHTLSAHRGRKVLLLAYASW